MGHKLRGLYVRESASLFLNSMWEKRIFLHLSPWQMLNTLSYYNVNWCFVSLCFVSGSQDIAYFSRINKISIQKLLVYYQKVVAIEK